MASISSRRLAKELKELATAGTPVGMSSSLIRGISTEIIVLTGIKLLKADDFETWILSLQVMGESLYKGEVFALQFRFDAQYPISSPEVVFVNNEEYQAPIHPHVYSNGHICASILGNEWSPVLSVSAVCITLQSMLASCTSKERPPDNDRYVRNAPKSPKQTRFLYDDDTV